MKKALALCLLAGLAGALGAAEVTPVGGYTGTPAPPSATYPTSGWINISLEKQVSVQVDDTSGADGVGVVQVWTRSCTTCASYITATCTNPPDKNATTTRCNFSIAPDAYLLINISAYTSGTFRVNVTTKR